MSATVDAIFTAPAKGAPVTEVGEVTVVPGCGVVGDRYWMEEGHEKPGNELTLIQAEYLDEVADRLAPGGHRRQIVTRGVALNDLVGKEFQVGEVVVRGVELCEPCRYLAGLTYPQIIKDLVHKGGLNAQIIHGGVIRVGDRVTV